MATEEKKSGSWRLQSGQYLGEVSALCFLHLPSHLSIIRELPYLVAGSGSQILVYDLELGTMMSSFDVFQGIRVHGICCGATHTDGPESQGVDFEIAVFGERRVKVFRLEINLGQQVSVGLRLLHLLPNFGNWVLDVSFIKHGEGQCLAIGCSDNSVHLWDVSTSTVVLQVQHPERTLLYSMRLWGETIEALRIASGTIYNEIIVWKVASQSDASCLTSQVEQHFDQSNSLSNGVQLHNCQYEAIHISKLAGHEGSIFRISWSSDGSKLVSVSDDRSARVWAVCTETMHSNKPADSIGLMLFGHSARVWDCCIFGSLIVTAGEDCTCRVWGLDGKHLETIKEHIGRGIWRCLYDPKSSLLITAGFDSAIKVHQLHIPFSGGLKGHAETKQIGGIVTYTTRIPTLSEHIGPMDSKSEYVRCLRFTCEDTLYVSTNHGYMYHAKLLDTEVEWTKLVRVSEEVPIVCMDLLSEPFKLSSGVKDWIAVGDGKGNMTVVGVIYGACTPRVGFAFTWSAGIERQLLGAHWCQSLGYGFIFTADPRGTLKLWRLCDHSATSCDVSLLAEFTSSFGSRIMCLDASLEEEVLVCGDIRGNLVLFPLLKSVLLGTLVTSDVKISPSSCFRGAHGISSISSVAVARLSSNQIEICSTGADGCICYLEYDKDRKDLEFIGMKQVKELSLIQSVSACNSFVNEPSNCHYAAGFASVDFIIWNLLTETKVFQIPCGGWRRPHSYYLGDVPEIKNCFAYVKDDIIYIHRRWVLNGEGKELSRNLHMQFHGREMHSICFVSEELQPGVTGKDHLLYRSSWIATGCEDGTVRLTRYMPDVDNWSGSKLLGEHVGGSAVRSICCVSKINILPSDMTGIPNIRTANNGTTENRETPTLLISVGAKRVLTSWLLRSRKVDKKEEIVRDPQHDNTGNGNTCLSPESPSMSFQWLSTDMPAKYSSIQKVPTNIEKRADQAGDADGKDDAASEKGNKDLNSCIKDKYEDDWRYMAVTAFLVKCANSRITVCFIGVACSDATLALRALVLPYRLWFDVAFLCPLSSPVLSLQHVILPACLPSEGNWQIGSLYILISGATDGSIAFWDLTRSIEAFMQLVSVLDTEKFIDCQKRPRTGRGSQGGRRWRSLDSRMSKNRLGASSTTVKAGVETDENLPKHSGDGTSSMLNDNGSSRTASSHAIHTASLDSEASAYDSSSDICEISPLLVFKAIHKSGVNSLHISNVEGCLSPEIGFLYNLISGGDDQALSCLTFELSLSTFSAEFDNMTLEIKNSITELGNAKKLVHSNQDKKKNYWIRFLNHDTVPSAHSSAVKGVWTDGSWVFSTGLDQRVRCWRLQEEGKLIEYAYLVISVPEPEALDAKLCGRNKYQIAVAGRGMQMLEFSEILASVDITQ
ncbi:putative transcription factor WD40-like family [Rosa chinensis]|uniref:Putative transcription factor WD40-like family n=2 Tax=Rosa chinensis TaxID=74649 RepID=A0A2P6RF85_ROSCH|nr:putative transcription factor WD40-like family [Rosa chinensis]